MIQASLRVAGETSAAPPLVGEGVGEQALRVAGGDAVAGDGGDLGRPGGGDGVVGQLDEVDAAGLGWPKMLVMYEILAARRGRRSRGRRLCACR